MDISKSAEFEALRDYRVKVMRQYAAVSAGALSGAGIVYHHDGSRIEIVRTATEAVRVALMEYLKSEIIATNDLLAKIGVTTPPFPTPES